jgi:DNA-binding response OmpR family regulator
MDSHDKILIDLKISKVLLEKQSFLNRADIRLFTAASNDEALAVHRAKHVDLIITDIATPGISTEQLFSLIRSDPVLMHVATIMVCACDPVEMSRSRRLGADAIILRPIKPSLLLAKAKQLLHLSWRETYRVLLELSVDGEVCGGTFSCRSLDISPQGLLAETTQTFDLGERVLCTFTLPDAAQVRVMGEVVHDLTTEPDAHVNRYGIHFLDLAPRHAKAIRNFLDSVAQQRSPAIH